ncbi:hypothetical protein SXIM_20070 [Streptomyces xiamenensis]|uniref:Uncharacterized protein n=1 Tax=Streptomyces xiamenensis TaxID=408015 RepID=A0A0F7CNR9_9ACTN|nr:hypothetical protein SXIM_20070 [Streptomyces xiamenensis]
MEVQAEAVLPQDDADGQIQQQGRQSAARGEPDGGDGDQQDQGAQQQELVEAVDRQRRVLSSSSPPGPVPAPALAAVGGFLGPRGSRACRDPRDALAILLIRADFTLL